MSHTCPVCAYPKLSEPPRSKSGGGSYEICPSCGFEFGVSDDDLGHTYESWRQAWQAGGMKWSSRGQKQPAAWNPAKQLVPDQRETGESGGEGTGEENHVRRRHQGVGCHSGCQESHRKK